MTRVVDGRNVRNVRLVHVGAVTPPQRADGVYMFEPPPAEPPLLPFLDSDDEEPDGDAPQGATLPGSPRPHRGTPAEVEDTTGLLQRVFAP
eukprot:gene6083-biopygen17809